MSDIPPIFVFADSTINSYGFGNFSDQKSFGEARANSVFSSECPYCKLPGKSFKAEAEWGVTGWVEDTFVGCARCGWWSYQQYHDRTDGTPSYDSVAAVLKKFSCDAPDIPIDPLVSHIARNDDLIRRIHPAKLEELVGAIYSNLLGYKVEYCSYARPDKGIDLVVVNLHDGRTLAIQVKRHKRPIELGSIHQFFGAMVDAERKQGVFVTTGDFRSGARSTASRLERKAKVSIDLIDGKRLLEFVGIMNASRPKPDPHQCPFWRSHPYFGER